MIISHKYKIIFIHIFKNAGTFITTFLKNLDENIDLQYIGHTTCKYGKEVLDPEIWNNYTKFCVIRNSWDFILSLYTYTKNCIFHLSYNLVKDLSFEEFLLIKDQPVIQQQEFILDNDNNIIVDYMINFDCLNTSLVHFFKEIVKIDLKTIMEALPRNKVNKSDKEDDYKHYYCDKTIELVSKMYEKDIVFFNFKYSIKNTEIFVHALLDTTDNIVVEPKNDESASDNTEVTVVLQSGNKNDITLCVT